MSDSMILVKREGTSAGKEHSIQIIQNRNVWNIDPRGEILRISGGYAASLGNSVVDFLNGLADARHRVIVYRNFKDEHYQNASEHIRYRDIKNFECYLYGFAFGLGKWDDVVLQLNLFLISKKAQRNPHFHNPMRVLRLTGMHYAANPWEAIAFGRIAIRTF